MRTRSFKVAHIEANIFLVVIRLLPVVFAEVMHFHEITKNIATLQGKSDSIVLLALSRF